MSENHLNHYRGPLEVLAGLILGAVAAWLIGFVSFGFPVGSLAFPFLVALLAALVLWKAANLPLLAAGVVGGALAETMFFFWLFSVMMSPEG